MMLMDTNQLRIEDLYSNDSAVCYEAIKRIKNNVIGSNRLKGVVLEQGTACRLVALMNIERHGDVAHEAMIVIGSLAKGTEHHLRQLIDANAVPALLLNTQSDKLPHVEASLRCLRTIFRSRLAPIDLIYSGISSLSSSSTTSSSSATSSSSSSKNAKSVATTTIASSAATSSLSSTSSSSSTTMTGTNTAAATPTASATSIAANQSSPILPHLISLAGNHKSSYVIKECIANILAAACQATEHQNIMKDLGAVPLIAGFIHECWNPYQVRLAALNWLAQLCAGNCVVSMLVAGETFTGRSMIDMLHELMGQKYTHEMQFLAAKCMTQIYRAQGIYSSDKRLLYRTLPTLIMLCKKDRPPALRAQAADVLAALTESDVSLQQHASVCDQLMNSLSDMLRQSTSSCSNRTNTISASTAATTTTANSATATRASATNNSSSSTSASQHNPQQYHRSGSSSNLSTVYDEPMMMIDADGNGNNGYNHNNNNNYPGGQRSSTPNSPISHSNLSYAFGTTATSSLLSPSSSSQSAYPNGDNRHNNNNNDNDNNDYHHDYPYDHHPYQHDIREAAFKAFASLGANDEEIRKKLIETEFLMDELMLALEDTSNMKVRLAALRCLHSLSRSVSQLRTTFQDHEVWVPLRTLLANPRDEVLSLASSVLCNLLLEFSPSKQHFLDRKAVELLCDLTRKEDTNIRLNGVWALMNMAYQAEQAVKTQILNCLGTEQIFRLLTDNDTSILMKTLGLLRNLLTTKSHIDLIMSQHGKQIMSAIILILEGEHASDVKEQALCILGNIADGTASKEYIMSNEDILKKLTSYMMNGNVNLQTAATFCITNLVWNHEDGAVERQERLKELSVPKILQQLVLSTNSALFDRAKTALQQFTNSGSITLNKRE